MSSAMHLAGPEDLAPLTRLVAAFHTETGIAQDEPAREAALKPLLEGSPYGAAYLLGPRRAPIGYVIVTFGWSIEYGGLDAIVDEVFIRPGVRGRGVASGALAALPRALSGAGIRAVHLEVARDDDAAQRLYARAGFRPRDRYMLMSRKLV